jgi:protein gp37
MTKSAIEWTDETWNPLRGCNRVSPGCTNCYAERVAMRFSGADQPYEALVRMSSQGPKWTGQIRTVPGALHAPLLWKQPRRVFVNSMSDLFHEAVPFSFVAAVLGCMSLASAHTFQVLTKRPQRMAEFFEWLEYEGAQVDSPASLCVTKLLVLAEGMPERLEPLIRERAKARSQWPLSNVWFGVSVEDQTRADERREPLCTVASAGWRTWVSYEPALGLVDWTGWDFIGWLVSGGESGVRARPSHPHWHRVARDWCAGAGVTYFFKQWGAWQPHDEPHTEPHSEPPVRGANTGASAFLRVDGHWGNQGDWLNGQAQAVDRIGKKAAGRVLDGRLHDACPEVQHAFHDQ